MLDSSLLQTLRYLTTTELQELDKFVHSRLFYHPKNATGVVNLFEELIQFSPAFEDAEGLTNDRIAAILGQTPQYVVKVASELHTVVKQYIGWAYQENKADAFFEQLALLGFYAQKNAPVRFNNLYEKLDKELKSQRTQISPNLLYKRYKLDEMKHIWLHKAMPTGDIHLGKTIESFDAFTILKNIQFIYNLSLRKLNYAFDIEKYSYILKDVERFCLQNPDTNNGLLLVYYEAILLVIDREDGDITRFQDLLTENSFLLGTNDFHSLYGLERQYLLKLYSNGRNELLPQILKVYQNHLEKGLLEGSGYLPPFTFSNIVRHACRLNELDWVEEFLEKYRHKLGGTENPEELYRLYYAYFLIFKKNFSEAEKNLTADFSDPITRVDARCFELMLLYEIDSELIDYKIESFRKLVRNTTGLPENRREGFHYFALALRKMINPDLKYNDKRIEKLVSDINASPTSEAIWLTQKLLKLKRKK